MGGRRSALEVDVAILLSIQRQLSSEDLSARKTRIQAQAYLNWKVLNRHLASLQRRGLLDAVRLRLTDRGLHFLLLYNAFLRSFLERSHT